MLTPEEITDAQGRLTGDGHIADQDQDVLLKTFRRVFAGLEQIYNYKFAEVLAAVEDGTNDKHQAAQIVACLVKMEELGFPVGELTGTKFGVKASAYEEFLGYVLFAFSTFYPIPVELSNYDIRWAILSRRGRSGSGGSSSARKTVVRDFGPCGPYGEAGYRRGY